MWRKGNPSHNASGILTTLAVLEIRMVVSQVGEREQTSHGPSRSSRPPMPLLGARPKHFESEHKIVSHIHVYCGFVCNHQVMDSASANK